MINPVRIVLIAIALFVLAAVGLAPAFAKGKPIQPIEVLEAIPDFAAQGEQGKLMRLRGKHFPDQAQVVFIFNNPLDPEDPNNGNETEVVTTGPVELISGELVFAINVESEAVLGNYDIEVTDLTIAGRKGKGTSLFSVQLRENQNREVNCAEFADVGKCTCRFILDPDTRIFSLIDDCTTSQTLVLNNARIVGLNGGSNGFSPTITAVNPFQGPSVIANKSESAGVRYLNIRFDQDVVRGCGTGIETAISFVLDGTTSDDSERNSFLQVRDMDIDTVGGAPLCTAIEVVREEAFDPQPPGYMDWKINVENSFVADGSYVESGIRLAGFVPQQAINPPKVFGNYVGAPACAGAATAAAIEFGRILLSDPADSSTQIAGVVESNIIRMAGCGGAGIWVVGDDYFEQHMTAVEIIKNDISGAFFGVLVDPSVDSANFSGNTLTGDGVSGSGDVGVYSEAACTTFKGKPDKISGYDNKTVDLGCP